MATVQFFQQAWPALIAGAPGVWALYREWRRRKAVVQVHRADLVKIAQDAASSVIKELRAEVDRQVNESDRLRERVDELEHEIGMMRAAHIETLQAKDARIALLEGDKHQLEARIAALERVLERNNIPIPPARSPFYEVAPSGELHSGVGP